MEIFLLAALVLLCHIVTLVVIRYFFKQLSEKVNFIAYGNETATTTPIQTPTGLRVDASGTSNNYRFKPTAGGSTIPFDPPAANEAASTDANDLELNEQNLTGLPADVKFEVEGGDTQTPPGFEEKK